MSCCGCLETPPRVTNIYRHEELLDKFSSLTGITIIQNTFICDPCVLLLNQSHSFRTKCIQIHEQLHENPLGSEETLDDLYNADEMVEYETEFLDEDPMIRLGENYGEEINEGSEDNIIYFTREAEEKKPFRVSENSKFNEKLDSDDQMDDMLEVVNDLKTDVEREELVTSEKTKRKSYFTYQKLEAIRYAEEAGSNRQAARAFSVDESCIRKWRQNKDLIATIDQERTAARTPRRKSNLHWPTLDQKLKIWVKEQLESGVSVKPKHVREKSIELAEELNLEDFKGSNSYVFKFMRRYHFPGNVLRKDVQSSLK